MKKIVILFICIILLLSSCSSSESSVPSYNNDIPKITSDNGDETSPVDDNTTFPDLSDSDILLNLSQADDSASVSISAEDAAEISAHIDAMSREYRFSELYQTEEAYKRITTPVPKVESHRFSALDSDGTLNADHLYDTVKKNNTEYLKRTDFAAKLSSAPKDKTIKEFCAIIVDTVNTMVEKYPDIDWERVYCNLGNLKIVDYGAMLSFAEVSSDLVMKVGENNREMSTIATGGVDRYDDIIAHETMHVIQVGCVCEEIENCNRRCGISRRYDDFEHNTSNITWLFEGGAERSVCNLTGREPTTYTTMIGYICSLDLACMLRNEVSTDCIEAVSFYDDPERLFSLFECETPEEYTEIMNMLISIHVIQTEENSVKDAYGEKYSIDMSVTDNINHMNRMLKTEVCRTMSKTFYRNLTQLLTAGKDISANDLCYLINLFETSIHTHLRFSDAELEEYNTEFIADYKELRGKLFDAVKTQCGVDIASLYDGYTAFTDDRTVNASMTWNDQNKNKFMLERTAYNSLNMVHKIK